MCSLADSGPNRSRCDHLQPLNGVFTLFMCLYSHRRRAQVVFWFGFIHIGAPAKSPTAMAATFLSGRDIAATRDDSILKVHGDLHETAIVGVRYRISVDQLEYEVPRIT